MAHPTSPIALELIEKNKLSKSPILDLGNCGLSSVPLEISEFYWLKTLIFSSVWIEYDSNINRWYRRSSENRGPANTLKTLEGIEHLTQLTALFCAGNSINNINPLKSLSKLEKLNCSNNRIKWITPLEHV